MAKIVDISVVRKLLSCVETLKVEIPTEDMVEVKDVVEIDGVVDRTGRSVDPSHVRVSSLVSSTVDASVTVAIDKKYAINV